MSRPNVAIVGGGASGTLAAIHLLREADVPQDIILFERAGVVGRGVAYATEDRSHVLNVPAGRMSALPDQPDHFLNWLGGYAATAADARPDAFVPRGLYGDYLDATLRESARAAAPGVRLLRIGDEVVDAHVDGDGALLVTRTGRRIRASRVILALGHRSGTEPAIDGAPALDASRYVRDPWRTGALDAIAPNGPVLIVGTGLTMVDVVLTLRARGHAGPFRAVSRRGLTSWAHVRPAPPAAPLALSSRAGRLRDLVREVRRAMAGQADPRAIIDGLRPRTQALWAALSLEDRRRFLRHVRPYWDTVRHRMAPEVGERVEALRREGALVVSAARVTRLAGIPSGIRATLRSRGDGAATTLDVACVVNATGPGDDFARSPEPLVAALLESGRIRPGPLGIALDTAGDGALIGDDGSASRVLYTLGPTRKGGLWETTAVPEIRTQARELASNLTRWPANLPCAAIDDGLRAEGRS